MKRTKTPRPDRRALHTAGGTWWPRLRSFALILLSLLAISSGLLGYRIGLSETQRLGQVDTDLGLYRVNVYSIRPDFVPRTAPGTLSLIGRVLGPEGLHATEAWASLSPEGGEALRGVETATSVRVRGGKVETMDGPVALDPFSHGRLVLPSELTRRALRAGLTPQVADRLDLLMAPVSDRQALIRLQNVLFSRALARHDYEAAERSALRRALLGTLQARTRTAAQDVFTPAALGLEVGNTFARLHGLEEVPTPPGSQALEVLIDAGLVRRQGNHGEVIPGGTARLATELGVAGLLQRRADRYRTERLVWEWWLLEVEWLRSPRSTRRRRRRAPTTPALLDITTEELATWRYPRGIDGRPRHTESRAIIEGLPTRAAEVEEQNLIMNWFDATIVA